MRFNIRQFLKYENIYKKTAYWHGTGKYRYDKKEDIVDIFQGILEADGLMPFEDQYNIASQNSKSISLTRHWFYALPYADMHLYNLCELNRTYSMEHFVSFKIAPVWRSIEQEIFEKKLDYEETVKKILNQRWGASINICATNASSAFLLRSDIKNNFPVIVGVKKIDKGDSLPKYLKDNEIRIAKNISLSNFTNLQVPYKNKKRIKLQLLIKRKNIPIFSIEEVEAFMRFKQELQLYFIICILFS